MSDTTDDHASDLHVEIGGQNVAAMIRAALNQSDIDVDDAFRVVVDVYENEPPKPATDGGLATTTPSNSGRGAKTDARELGDISTGVAFHYVLDWFADQSETRTAKEAREELGGEGYSPSTITSAVSALWKRKLLERGEDRPYQYWISDHGAAILEDIGRYTSTDLDDYADEGET